MKRPKLRKGSKRVSCSKRFKIQKKVREHNRKLRKEAKKKGVPKRAKKDPGVPNDAPFKEDILREAELRKQRLEELKQKQKLDRQKEQAKKRKVDAKKKDPASKKQPEKKKSSNEKQPTSKQMEDKHSPKFFCRELNKVIQEADVVLEVLDARDPFGCRCPQLEQAVIQASGNKKMLLVLNKIDLVPKEVLEKWLESLKNEFPTVAFKCATQLQDMTTEVKQKRKEGRIEVSRGNTCLGGDTLMNLLHGYCTAPEQVLKVGVVGFPNVGKSSLINSLKQMRACNVGPARGTTKCVQEVNIDKQIKMLDSPSIVASPSNSAIALSIRSAFDTGEGDLSNAVNTILKHCNKQQVMLQYSIPDYRSSPEFLILLAQKRGLLKKGGIPDTDSAARLLLSDWIGAKVSYHCHPPDSFIQHPHHSKAVVKEMQQGIDLIELEQYNHKSVQTVKCPNLTSSILFQSPGLTSGIIEEGEIVEVEKVRATEEEVASEDEESASDQEEGDDLSEDDEIEEDGEDTKEETGHEDLFESNPVSAKTVQRKSGKEAVLKQQETGTPSENEVKGINVDLDRSIVTDDAYDFNTDYV